MCSCHINDHRVLFRFHSQRRNARGMPPRALWRLFTFVTKCFLRHGSSWSAVTLTGRVTCALWRDMRTRRKLPCWIMLWNSDIRVHDRWSPHSVRWRCHSIDFYAMRRGLRRWWSWWLSVWWQRVMHVHDRCIAWNWHVMRQWSSARSWRIHTTIRGTRPRGLRMTLVNRRHAHCPSRNCDWCKSFALPPLGPSILKPHL